MRNTSTATAPDRKRDLVAALMASRELSIRRARASFWEFCRLLEPEFYKPSRPHLWKICNVLQALFERRLTDDQGRVYTRLMMNIPPRHGKSRTLINFCRWALGKNPDEKVITCSYNDDLATDFSKYTRNGIQERKAFPYEVDYSDIFPGVAIKKGDASFKQWALEGQYFTYKGAGVGAGITGKGCSISITDDPVKDAATAFNDHALDEIWQWYTGTFRSRLEEGGIQILNMTRWAKRDACGRLLESKEAAAWYILKMEAQDESGEMLCPDLLSRESYEDLKALLPVEIFRANYHQEPIDIQGRLYQQLRTYDRSAYPEDFKYRRIIAYVDTADQGSDYLCAIVAGETPDLDLDVLDVLYTKEPMEVTEPATADLLIANQAQVADIESNAGGRGFARAVEREMLARHRSNRTVVRWFSQSGQKESRILTQSAWVQRHVRFPADWSARWPEFYMALQDYRKEGRNKNDDAPDALTGLAEMVTGKSEARVRTVSGMTI